EARCARGAIGHDAFRRRNDGDAEPLLDTGQFVFARVITPARRAAAFQALDHRTPFVILELHLENPFDIAAFAEILDVAFVLQHLGDGALHARSRNAHRHLLGHLAVTDTREHIGDRIGHHLTASPKYSFTPSLAQRCGFADPRPARPCTGDRFRNIPVLPRNWHILCGIAGANRRYVCSRSIRLAYQLALTTPGTSPRMMVSRNFIRLMPNLR